MVKYAEGAFDEEYVQTLGSLLKVHYLINPCKMIHWQIIFNK